MDTTPTRAATDYIEHGSASYSFLPDPVVDALVQVVLELGAETWITRRRMLVLERVISAHNLLPDLAVETYTPTAEDAAAWREERDRMMRSVYAALARRPGVGDTAAELAKSPNPPRRPPLNAAAPAPRAKAMGASAFDRTPQSGASS
jgi:hypothetical protein